VITAMPRIAIAVGDFAGAVATFRDGFGMPVVDFSDRTVHDLGAHVAMCMPEGGSNIELMAPADRRKPLSQALQKCLDRRGEGFYALMLEAPVPDDEAVVLAERGLDVLPLMKGAGGRDIHPRSTHGVLIRVYPDGSVRNPGGLSSEAPGLSGIARVIIATTDASLATDAYGRGLGLDTGPATVDDERGVRCAVARPPKGGIIELVSATDPTKPFGGEIERFVKEEHEGIYALVLHAEDPAAAAATLADRGIPMGGTDGRAATVFGARIVIE
jgi:catechol 2,3-dioxygenase-like lactoylglutathione lyase family enzyme